MTIQVDPIRRNLKFGLPKGKVLKSPYPAVGVSVVKKSGILEGYVGSDSSVGAPDLTIRD